MPSRSFLLALVFVLLTAVGGCSQQSSDGFRPITDWRAWRSTGIPPEWTIKDGVVEHRPGGGDLVSVETFRNFELRFEWKISTGGNSGVMYRASEDFPAPYQTGPEYQILDNGGHADGKSPLTSAGSVYGLYAPAADFTRPVGEWNSAAIIVRGNGVEHWLNGQMALSYEFGSPGWQQRVAGSKFAAWPDFGTVKNGHIDLQDHGNAVSYRNIIIKVLPD